MKRASKKSLFFFLKRILGMSLLDEDIHGPLCRMLEADPRYAVAWLPRGWFKTSVVTVGHPIWVVANIDPMRTFGIGSNVVDKAMDMVGEIMAHFESNELFQALYPEIIPNFKKRWGKKEACIKRPGIDKEATFEAIGIGGTGTSKHFTDLKFDDLLYPKKDELTREEVRPSQANADAVIGFQRMSYNLWKNRRTGRKHIVGTPMFLYGLKHHIETNEPQYKKATYIRQMVENGKPAWGSYCPQEVIDETRQALGPYLFATQCMMQPVAPEDMVFQEEWIRNTYWYREERRKILDQNPYIYVLVDPAVGEKKKHDYTAIVSVASTPNGHIWVLSYQRGHWATDKVIDRIFKECAQWPKVSAVGIEVYGGFIAVKHLFMKEMQYREQFYRVIDLKALHGDIKDHRIEAMQPDFAAGKVHIEAGMAELQNDLLQHPYCKKPDLIDALSYYVQVIRKPGIEVSTKPRPEIGSYEAIHEDILGRKKRPGLAFDIQDAEAVIGEDDSGADDYFTRAAKKRGDL